MLPTAAGPGGCASSTGTGRAPADYETLPLARHQDHWFASDLIHLTLTGQAHLAVIIRDAVIAELAPS